MSFFDDYPTYVSAEERQARARQALANLRKSSPHAAPVEIAGQTIATTWWGKAWNKNLEMYADHSNRISRGRTYVRQGAVIDLQIGDGAVKALVQGSGRKPYEVVVAIDPMPEATWQRLLHYCEGQLNSMEELLEGRFPKELRELFALRGEGLFPTSREIHFDCSCYDIADMCKHVTAALCGIGARFDEDPMLFFRLRDIDVDVLIKESVEQKMARMLENAEKKTSRVIDEDEAWDLFF
ncbi:hypothetical protein [Alkalicoccus chagannorensis]|uniref:SWIM zinc finger family protein n=1 Tax=Alkalicoccus chagannorensis TaxID=427072 RepID=UPI00040C9496|nr:hypothetical protein [Alkalicoccus chagannorensis]